MGVFAKGVEAPSNGAPGGFQVIKRLSVLLDKAGMLACQSPGRLPPPQGEAMAVVAANQGGGGGRGFAGLRFFPKVFSKVFPHAGVERKNSRGNIRRDADADGSLLEDEVPAIELYQFIDLGAGREGEFDDGALAETPTVFLFALGDGLAEAVFLDAIEKVPGGIVQREVLGCRGILTGLLIWLCLNHGVTNVSGDIENTSLF